MDDLHKGIFKVWELRLKLEKTLKRLRRIEVVLESEEYRASHSIQEYQANRKEVQEIKKEQYLIEETQLKLEEKIKLPNPYLKN